MRRDSGFSAPLNSGALLVFLSTYWLLSAYRAISAEFSSIDIPIVVGWSAGFLILEIGLLFLVQSLFRISNLTKIVAAVFLVLNAFSLNLILNAGFLNLGKVAIAAILVAGVFVAFTIVRMMTESRLLRRGILALAGLLAVSPAAALLLDGPSEEAAAPGNPSKIVRNVDFVQKPNVYFIGFESMAAPAVLSKYLQLSDTPLEQAFKRLDFRMFKNMFTESAPTKPSLNGLLALEFDYLRAAADAGYPLFSGMMPSPLLEIFKHNGYETTTLYNTGYFGERAGPYVDHYQVNERFSVCTFMRPHEVAFAFFGVCRLHGQGFWAAGRKVEGAHIDHLMVNLEEISERPRPQFLLAHIAPLAHTAKEFTGTPEEVAEFRTKYLALSEKAASNLERIVDFVGEQDPEALLFVFGDHGAWLSREVGFRDDPDFYMQDRFGTMAGFYPKEACASSFDSPISSQFTTTPQVARMVIRCLAGGVDAFDPSYEHRVTSRRHRFEEYLYE